MPNVFNFVAEDQFATRDLQTFNKLIHKNSDIEEMEEEDFFLYEENDRKRKVFDFPSEALETVIRGRKNNSSTIQNTNIKAISQGIRKNNTKSVNKISSKVKNIALDDNDVSKYRSSMVFESKINEACVEKNSFEETDCILEDEEVKEVMLDYEFIKEKYLIAYGIDLGVLLTNAFNNEKVAVKKLVELLEENEDLEEVMTDMLKLSRESKIDLFNMKGGF